MSVAEFGSEVSALSSSCIATLFCTRTRSRKHVHHAGVRVFVGQGGFRSAAVVPALVIPWRPLPLQIQALALARIARLAYSVSLSLSLPDHH